MSKEIRKVKNFGQFLTENTSFDETKTEYYLRGYKDGETYTAVNTTTDEDKIYSGEEYRALFMAWFNKIKPFLDKNDEHAVIKILVNWDEETLAKFDMYSMVKNYFKK